MSNTTLPYHTRHPSEENNELTNRNYVNALEI